MLLPVTGQAEPGQVVQWSTEPTDVSDTAVLRTSQRRFVHGEWL